MLHLSGCAMKNCLHPSQCCIHLSISNVLFPLTWFGIFPSEKNTFHKETSLYALSCRLKQIFLLAKWNKFLFQRFRLSSVKLYDFNGGRSKNSNKLSVSGSEREMRSYLIFILSLNLEVWFGKNGLNLRWKSNFRFT